MSVIRWRAKSNFAVCEAKCIKNGLIVEIWFKAAQRNQKSSHKAVRLCAEEGSAVIWGVDGFPEGWRGWIDWMSFFIDRNCVVGNTSLSKHNTPNLELFYFTGRCLASPPPAFHVISIVQRLLSHLLIFTFYLVSALHSLSRVMTACLLVYHVIYKWYWH